MGEAAGTGSCQERGVGDTSVVSVTHSVAEVASHGEVTRVPLPGSHSASGALPERAAALIETDPALAGGDKRSHLLKLDQRNPAWINLGFFYFFPFLLFAYFFFSVERERHCLL